MYTGQFYSSFIHFQLQTFFGNMFVRSTDLLNLANVSPDQSFAVHLKVDETLEVGTNMAVQCALLYTSSKGLLITIWFSDGVNDLKLQLVFIRIHL